MFSYADLGQATFPLVFLHLQNTIPVCSFQRFTVSPLKVSLSFNIINNYVPRWQFKAQNSTRTTPQAGQVTFLQFCFLWCEDRQSDMSVIRHYH
jgi:hypothetical protein